MRKSKLTDELREEICDLLAAGNTDKDVCEVVGIHKSTFYDWIKQGEQATRGRYSEFSDAVTRARAEAREGAVETLRRAIEGRLETVEEYTELVNDTRIGRDGKPYPITYEKTFRKVIKQAADWRAAVEYLKRRDADNWSEKINTEQHITIESAVETAADEFERIIRQRVRSEPVAGSTDDTTEGSA